MKPMRINLWRNILEDLGPPEGCYLPPWLIAVYCLIFPCEGVWALLNRAGPFDLFTMTWKIHGVKYSDLLFYRLALDDGAWFKFQRHGDIMLVTARSDDSWSDS